MLQKWVRKRQLALYLRTADGAFVFNRLIGTATTLGTTLTDLPSAPSARRDEGTALDVELHSGALSSITMEQLLNGANAAAIGTMADGFEIVQFRTAALIAPGHYRLTGFLRGLFGSEQESLPLRSTGVDFVLLDSALLQPALEIDEGAREITWRLGPAQLDVGHASYVEFTTPVCLRGLRPLAPASVSAAQGADGLSLSWIRQTRSNGDSWDLTDVPLGEEAERYRLTIWDVSTLKRTVETSAPQFLYAAADLTADFGSLPATITLRIAQLSATLGAGTTLERTIHV